MKAIDVKKKLEKRKRRKKRRLYLMFFTVLILLLSIYLIRSPYFKVDNVSLTGFEQIPEELIQEKSDNLKGISIFLSSKKEIENILAAHPYFNSMSLKRSFPKTIEITIEEEQAAINYLSTGTVYLLSGSGKILEMGGNLNEDSLTLTDTLDSLKLGEYIYKENPDKMEFLDNFIKLRSLNESNIPLNGIDLTNFQEITLKVNQMNVQLGGRSDLKAKINQAINILNTNDYANKVGYVDVSSYPDTPVVFVEINEDAAGINAGENPEMTTVETIVEENIEIISD